MRSELLRVLGAAIPIIALLVGAAFVVPPDFPWLVRQALLAAVGVGGVVMAELGLFATPPSELARRLGLVPSDRGTILRCAVVTLPMWLFLPLAKLWTGSPVTVAADWLAILAGVILVNGLAEEVIHRAFIFGRLRARAGFLHAASVGAAVFALQHAYLVATMGVVAGLASVVLALLLAYPLCRAFEDGGNSLAGPVILHTGANASFMVFGEGAGGTLLLPHMAVVLVCLYTLFLFPRRREATP